MPANNGEKMGAIQDKCALIKRDTLRTNNAKSIACPFNAKPQDKKQKCRGKKEWAQIEKKTRYLLLLNATHKY